MELLLNELEVRQASDDGIYAELGGNVTGQLCLSRFEWVSYQV